MNSTSSKILAGAVEAVVARLTDFNDELVGLMTLDELINFANDCDMLVIKSRFDGPDPLNKAIRIMGGGIVAVLERRSEGPAKEWDSFFKVLSPLTISYNLLKMRPGSIQAMTPKYHQVLYDQDLLEFNQGDYVKTFFDYLTSAINICIFIIRIEQDLFDKSSRITNSSQTVAKLRTEAIRYLERAATENIPTSDRGGLITANMAKGVKVSRLFPLDCQIRADIIASHATKNPIQ